MNHRIHSMATLCLEVTQECNNVNMVQDSQTLPKIKKRCINIYITFTGQLSWVKQKGLGQGRERERDKKESLNFFCRINIPSTESFQAFKWQPESIAERENS